MTPRSPARTPLPPQAVETSDARILLPQGNEVAVRVYGQRAAGGGAPLVLHFHGGAFVAGDLENGSTVAGLLAGAGARVVSLAYPLAPASPFPQGVEVAYEMLVWVHKHRVKLAGQGARVFVAGEEAGGNLAAAVAMVARDRSLPPLAGQILLSPMLDPCVGTASLRERTGEATGCKWADGWQQYLHCPMDAEHPYAVPGVARRLGGLPPTLVLSGADDPLRDEARAYAERLQAAGITASFHLVPGADGWPDALFEPARAECACAASVQGQFRAFFEATSEATSPPQRASPGAAPSC